MRSSRSTLLTTGLVALASHASAQVASVCPSTNVCFKLNIPESTASSGSGDIFFQISAPNTYSWVALGQGRAMSGSNIFVVYTSADGNNVTLSPRSASGYNMPTLNSAAQAELLEGSGVSNGIMTANIKCSNCNSWSGGTADFQASSGNWIYAYQPSGGALNTDDQSASIRQHSQHDTFSWNYANAKGGSSVNPLVSTAPTGTGTGTGPGDSTVTSCIPRGAQATGGSGSGSATAANPTQTSGNDDNNDDSRTRNGRPTSWPTARPSGRPPGDDDNDDDSSSRRAKRQSLPYCDDVTPGNGDFTSIGSGGAFTSQRRTMLIAHGVLASLAFVILFPAGAIAIRLGSFPGVVWLHAAFQIFAYLVYIAAFGLGVYIASQMEMLDHHHPIIGIAVFIAVFVQPIFGYLHHLLFKKYQSRTLWSYVHVWLGRAVITLGIINGGLGLQLADSMNMSSRGGIIAYAVIAAIVWLVWVVAIVIGERRRARSQADAPPKYEGGSRRGPRSSNRTRSDDTESSDDIPRPDSRVHGHYAPKNHSTSRRSNSAGQGTSPLRRSIAGHNDAVFKATSLQCADLGHSAALCQVFDSIFYDVPMARVKFNANTEYAYLQNFKILQNTFAKHHVDKPIRVESLVKCKMQDNLEFLQFVKQYWDQHFPGHDYDPVARRGAKAVPGGGAPAPRAAPAAARRAPAASNTAAPRTRTPLAPSGGAASAALKEENTQLKETVSGLERERDFYFSKLRDIELLIQQAMEADPELEKDEGLLKQIQTILYSTEEGFEIPAEGVEGLDEETF
ncbi:hypothetical protein OPT61_g1295 [Boeremia exigua]|uniref:Uncharacterized protein n=1 Tax=Boeremia exigua TaxID=749465 RepID=A0ACC2IR51_9PLEO|nr:hypothetical protein OPT61_g1295 [Boeremia exigua]